GGAQERPEPHPNAQTPQAHNAAPATQDSVAPPPMEELELITLLADHPALIATAEADKAFWLLTDARLRDMYSAARDGQSFLELAPAQLSPPTAQLVLSGKYASNDPSSSPPLLAEVTRNLEVRDANANRMKMAKVFADARRRGDHDLARQLAQENVAQRTGNRELATALAEQRKAGSRTETMPEPRAEKLAPLV